MLRSLGRLSCLGNGLKVCLYMHQDSAHARFTPCSLPYISGIPAIIAVLVLVSQVLRLLFPHVSISPRGFAKERPAPYHNEFGLGIKERHLGLASMLLLVSVVGTVVQAVATFYPSFTTNAVFPLVAWVWAPLHSSFPTVLT